MSNKGSGFCSPKGQPVKISPRAVMERQQQIIERRVERETGSKVFLSGSFDES